MIAFPNLGETPMVTLADRASGMEQLDRSENVCGTHLKFPASLSPASSDLTKSLFFSTLQL